MNERTKQKALIIALVALVLGTGSLWFARRDSSSSTSTHVSSAPKRQRVQADTQDTNKRTRSRSNAVQENKRERTFSDKQNSKKRTRRGRKLKVKKKKVPPYA